MIFIVHTNTCFGIGCFIDDINSYKKIYEIKGRNYLKPMAIFLNTFENLQKITNLSNNQIKFLKSYSKPWTILVNKNQIEDKKLLNSISKLSNANEYKKIAFRIAHMKEHFDLIRKGGYFFLTSANKSGQNEIKSLKKIKEIFKKEQEQGIVKVLSDLNYEIPGKYYFSDVFEFENDDIKIKYYRKN